VTLRRAGGAPFKGTGEKGRAKRAGMHVRGGKGEQIYPIPMASPECGVMLRGDRGGTEAGAWREGGHALGGMGGVELTRRQCLCAIVLVSRGAARG
jgi:hypothetical protein